MATARVLVRRFAGPVIAAYLLHWGVWWLVLEAEQIILSEITKVLTCVSDHSPAGFPRIEAVYWSARVIAVETASEGLLPIALGLLVGWWVLHRKQKSPQRAF